MLVDAPYNRVLGKAFREGAQQRPRESQRRTAILGAAEHHKKIEVRIPPSGTSRQQQRLVKSFHRL